MPLNPPSSPGASCLASKLVGYGHYLPEKVVTNKDLEAVMETSDDWIQKRTGIKQRHQMAPDQTPSDMAAAAGKAALKKAGLSSAEVDLIIVATSTPDLTFPSTAVVTQQKLGVGGNAFAFDMNAVCSGFLYALVTADAYIRSGQVKTALVIGAEAYSKLIDYKDRTTAVLFGDGAGAFVLQGQPAPDNEHGILASCLYSDGQFADLLTTTGGTGSTQTNGQIYMNGREVFKHAVTKMADAVDECLARAGLPKEDIDWLVPHQANKRIIDGVGQKLGLDPDRVVVTVDQHANTSAASIPLAFSASAGTKNFKEGDLILFEALGAGFTWGAALLKI